MLFCDPEGDRGQRRHDQFQRVDHDLPQTVRVLVNSQSPSQRGIFVDVPGTVVDLLADPMRNAYYVLRQDKNEVLVFNSANNAQKRRRCGTCTKPTGMAITFDQENLLVGVATARTT